MLAHTKMTSTATRGLFTRGSVVRDPAKEYKGYTDDSGLYRPTIDEVEKQLESQWCGCGAKPGHNLRRMPWIPTCGASPLQTLAML